MTDSRIFLILSYTGSIPSRLIRALTGASFSHISLVLDSAFTEFYSFGRKRPNNFFVGGFVVEGPDRGVFRKFPKTTCRILELSVTEEQYQCLRGQIDAILSEKELYRYSFLGLFLALFRKSCRRPRCMYCSEFVRLVFERAGIDVSSIPAVARPADFAAFPGAGRIYEGRLNRFLPLKKPLPR